MSVFRVSPPDYSNGDCYEDEKAADAREQWRITIANNMPYLQHVKDCGVPPPPPNPHYGAPPYPHLGVLADFMEVGTDPTRWPYKDPDEQSRRWEKTNVCRLDYPRNPDDEVEPKDIKNPQALQDALKEENEAGWDEDIQLRLYVVEDLSRDVIEHFGAHYDIDPAFFRDHIMDFAWHNVRDPWKDYPKLAKDFQNQSWTQIRYVTARYFEDEQSYTNGAEEAKQWNVKRRPDKDFNRAFWDTEKAHVTLTRQRATFWLKLERKGVKEEESRDEEDRPTDLPKEGRDENGEPKKEKPPKKRKAAIGILLLDPTITAGFPLWRGRRNWAPTPSRHRGLQPIEKPPRDTFFKDFIYWASKPSLFSEKPSSFNSTSGTTKAPPSVHAPIQALLQLTCEEWLTLADYIKTRLSQIDWEIAEPETFAVKGNRDPIDIKNSLLKLHVWRRYVPLFREMLAETLDRVFHFPCYGPSGMVLGGGPVPAPAGTQSGPATTPAPTAASPNRLSAGDASTSSSSSSSSNSTAAVSPHYSSSPSPGARPSPTTGAAASGPIDMYRHDFELVFSYMLECQKRIDRLTSVVVAVIGINDSERSSADNKNIGRLSWLATLFLPFNLIAATFSMQAKVTDISGTTVRWYFAVALPVAVVVAGVAIVLSMKRVQKLLRFGKYNV